MLPVENVELTKVHYFETTKHLRNVAIKTVSQEVFENTFNRNVIIKKNIFGHKWVLKINEVESDTLKNKRSVKFWLYSVVFVCILIAMLSSLFFTFNLEEKLFHTHVNKKNKNESESENTKNQLHTNFIKGSRENGHTLSGKKYFNLKSKNFSQEFHEIPKNYSSTTNSGNSSKIYCVNCTNVQVCMKTEETEKPKCLDIIDEHDPTGCGGICLLNVEYCAVLDRKHGVFQCTPLHDLLKCPKGSFNCGEQCISKGKVCDGVIHCKGMQDEENCDCNLEENFLCTSSTLCLPKRKLCDGFIDCWDKSDESQCHKGCSSQKYSCLNGQCIPGEYFCDGTAHCFDASDEPQGCQI